MAACKAAAPERRHLRLAAPPVTVQCRSGAALLVAARAVTIERRSGAVLLAATLRGAGPLEEVDRRKRGRAESNPCSNPLPS